MTPRQTPDAVREAVALLPKLRDLLKPATARPWRVFDGGRGLLAIMKGDRPKIRSTSAQQRWKEIVKWAGFDGTDVGKRYDHANITLMVEAVNALPTLLDAIEHMAALDSRADERAAILADIGQRNAGKPVVTIWVDGSFVVHGFRDAEITTLCEPEKVILTLDLESWKAVQFITPQQRVDLAQKLFPATPAPAVDAVPAGEVAEQAHAAVRDGDYRMGYLRMCEAYGKLAALSHGEGRK